MANEYAGVHFDLSFVPPSCQDVGSPRVEGPIDGSDIPGSWPPVEEFEPDRKTARALCVVIRLLDGASGYLIDLRAGHWPAEATRALRAMRLAAGRRSQMLSIAHSRRFGVSSLVLVIALVLALLSPALPAVADEDFSGSLANGTQWIAVVPDDWNGTLLLHSHGYLPSFVPFPNPAPTIDSIPAAAELLGLGYAVAASSYADKGWALPTAPQDQVASLQAAIEAIGTEPGMVLAYGTSMGGLVTAQLAESAGDVIDGAMPTCGIVAGGADLNNYQLDGAHAVNELLADGSIQIAGYVTQGDAFAASAGLQAAVNAATIADTPEARARVALAAAFYQLDPSDLADIIGFVTPARFDLITAAGGEAGWNEGVDYERLFARSPYRRMVAALYSDAGLSLQADLKTLTDTADVPFN
jgi:pimeloyl-ACP methyl ester carboxylesterase